MIDKIIGSLTKQRELTILSLSETTKNKFFDFVVPKHSEVTLFILSIGLLISYTINPKAKEFLNSFLTGDSVSFYLVTTVTLISIFISIISIFLPKEMPGFHSFFAPFFIVICSAILALEYFMNQFQPEAQINPVNIFFAIYHMAMTIILQEIDFEKITKRISGKIKTPIYSIVLANILLISTFIFFYLFKEVNSFSWAIPITTSLFIWQIIDGFIIKGSRIEAPTTV